MAKLQHAELSGSRAHRWIKCPGSVAMEKKYPRASGPAAREGTTAHALGEQILSYWKKTKEGLKGLRDRFKPGFAFRFEDHGEKLEAIATEDMLDAVFVYVEYVVTTASKPSCVELELHVSLENLVRDNMYGTADCVIDDETELIVVDYKNGYVPVFVGTEDDPNAQLMYYAAGALDAHGWKHETVRLVVIQPRSMDVESVQELVMTAAAVQHWATETLYAAAHATDGSNVLVPGDHCRFCDALDACPKTAEVVSREAGADFAELAVRSKDDLPEIPTRLADLSRVLRAAPVIDAWIRACEERAHELLTAGKDVPGFKLVDKRANRAWPTEDPKKLEKLIRKAGHVKPFSLFKEKLKSPAQLEKEIGKEIVAKVAIKPEAGTTVALDTNVRPAVGVGRDFEELL